MSTAKRTCPDKHRPSRRTFALGAGAALAAATLPGPFVLRARAADPVRIGLLHPMSGFYGNAGRQCRAGAEMAIADVNAEGGLEGLDGAKVEAVNADVQSVPESAIAPITTLDDAGVLGVVGAYASGIAIAASQAAADRGLAFCVDVGVSDRIVRRGLTNTFRLGPGYAQAAVMLGDKLADIGPAARSVMIIHVDAPYGRGVKRRLGDVFRQVGLEVRETLPTAVNISDFRAIVRRVEEVDADILVPAVYFEDYANTVRAVKGSSKTPRLIASLFGGAASSPNFVSEHTDIAERIVDCAHWYDAGFVAQAARRKAAAERDIPYGHEVFMTYNATRLLLDAIDKAGRRDRQAVIAALAGSTFDGHGMPYGRTRFVEGQNTGASPAITQVQGSEIRLVAPKRFADAELLFGTLATETPEEGADPVPADAEENAATGSEGYRPATQ